MDVPARHPMIYFEYCPGICLKGLLKTMRSLLARDIQCHSSDFSYLLKSEL